MDKSGGWSRAAIAGLSSPTVNAPRPKHPPHPFFSFSSPGGRIALPPHALVGGDIDGSATIAAMSTTAPTTPERTTRKSALTRSFTVPANAAASAAASRTSQPNAEIGATEGVETLFTHANTKILKFTSSAPSRPGSSTRALSPGENTQGTLPWATLTEKTMAAGPLEIYRVPGSVSFLHSGSLLHAILPRSNCWCVDGVSKFAMRVLPDTYYRIELPGETPEDLERVEEFKVTLAKVLFYERTACPFARTFTVHLPDEPQPKKKRRRTTHGPAKKWKLDKAYSWRPEGWEPGQDEERPSDESSGSATGSDDEGSASSAEGQADELADQVREMRVNPSSQRPTVRERAHGLNLRSVTAPPQMSLQSTPPSKLRTSILADRTPEYREESRSSSSDAQEARDLPAADVAAERTLQAIPTDMPPSPPDSSAGFDFASPDPPSRTALLQQLSYPADCTSVRDDPSLHVHNHGPTPDVTVGKGPAAASRLLAPAVQLDAIPYHRDVNEAEGVSIALQPNHALQHRLHGDASPEVFGNTEEVNDAKAGAEPSRGEHESWRHSHGTDQSASPLNKGGIGVDVDRDDGSDQVGDTEEPAVVPDVTEQTPVAETVQETTVQDREADLDPFAQIQARIQARRSIGATNGFEPIRRETTRQSSSSTASSGSLKSRRSRPSDRQQDQAFASALVKRAYSVFLGPPAHLVIIMLKIAARFAKGALPSSLLYESPADMPKRVPGSFDLDGSDVEDLDDEALDDLEEDDFGVPLRSPVRMLSTESVPRQMSNPSVKERKGWQVET